MYHNKDVKIDCYNVAGGGGGAVPFPPTPKSDEL